MARLIPTIFEKDISKAERKIELVKDYAGWIQIDVTDGVLVKGKTFEPELLTKLSFSIENNLFDFHLMVNEPEKWIEKSLFAGASRIIGQVERMENIDRFVATVKDEGAEVGLAFDIDTELKEIPEDTDVVLLMGRKMGFGSYELDKNVYKKIEALVKYRNDKERRFEIGIDGGISIKNICELQRQGMDIAYVGGTIFNGNVSENWDALRAEINSDR